MYTCGSVSVSWGEQVRCGWFGGAEEKWLWGSNGVWALLTAGVVKSKLHTNVPQEATRALVSCPEASINCSSLPSGKSSWCLRLAPVRKLPCHWGLGGGGPLGAPCPPGSVHLPPSSAPSNKLPTPCPAGGDSKTPLRELQSTTQTFISVIPELSLEENHGLIKCFQVGADHPSPLVFSHSGTEY